MRWATVLLALFAIGEAAFIVRLLLTQSAAPASAPAAAIASTVPPARPEVQQVEPPSAAAPAPLVVATATVDPKLPEIRTLQPPAPAVRTGGFRLTTPIELTVLDGERVIGSSADGPIFASAGRHEFEFVNSAIGYRMRQLVDVKPGQIVSLTVPVPNGTLNINAQPWAAVFIDGNAVGETPLGNLSVVPGEHEVVFRHPQLGERREKTMVKPGAETRVSVNLQR
jgi:hypothetical protein